MSDLYALSRAMREALRDAMDDTPGWYDLARAAIFAFDKALAEGPAATGCARNQTTTQYCAEAVDAIARAEAAEARIAALEKALREIAKPRGAIWSPDALAIVAGWRKHVSEMQKIADAALAKTEEGK